MHDKTKVNALTCTSETVFKFNCIMSVETTHLSKFEYYISPVHVRAFTFVLPWVRGVMLKS